MVKRKDSSGQSLDASHLQQMDKTDTCTGPTAAVNICVVGGGFVGLVTAAGFAEFGHNCVCVEKDRDCLEHLEKGRLPFFERDLEVLIARNVESGRLSFTSDLAEAVKTKQAIFVTVGTPTSETGRSDLSTLDDVIAVLAETTTPDQVIVLKSTVPVGTGRRIQAALYTGKTSDQAPVVINNPEFLREGNAVHDFFHPGRLVIGGSNPWAVKLVTDIYRLGMPSTVPIVTTNNETAEMIKYASNAFLATKVGFVNELAGLCDQEGVNVLEVAYGMGLDRRISPDFLDPGPGWGGPCFHKDLLEFTGLARESNYEMLILKAVLDANARQFSLVVEKVKSTVGSLEGKIIAVLGLAYKANTSDMRDSPAIPIIRQMLREGAAVKAHDPRAMIDLPEYLPEIETAGSAVEAAMEADCILVLTEWQEYQHLDFCKIGKTMRQRNLVDARNLIAPEQVQRFGFNYVGMGHR